KAVALPLRLQFEELLPRQFGLPVQIAPKRFLHLRQEVLEVLADRCYQTGVAELLSRSGFCLLRQSQLTPSRLLHNQRYVTHCALPIEGQKRKAPWACGSAVGRSRTNAAGSLLMTARSSC